MDFVCDKCNKNFNQKAHLKYHIEKEVCEGKSFQCNFCGKGFTTHTSMYRHIRNSCKIKKRKIVKKTRFMNAYCLLALEKENKQIKKESK